MAHVNVTEKCTNVGSNFFIIPPINLDLAVKRVAVVPNLMESPRTKKGKFLQPTRNTAACKAVTVSPVSPAILRETISVRESLTMSELDRRIRRRKGSPGKKERPNP